MKVVRLLILLAVLVGGLVIGSLNSASIEVSLGFWALRTTSGIAIIVSLLLGTVLGGALVAAGVVIPLYARLRRANKALQVRDQAQVAAPIPNPFDGR